MRIAVVGGGVAGLAAALRLVERAPAARVTVYEQGPLLGGKLRTGVIAGQPVEYGAEAFLTRDPAGGDSAAVELARALGLAGDLVHPATSRAAIAVGGALHPIPPGTLVGVPGDLAALPPVAHPAAHADSDGGRPLLADGQDVAVGALVRRRLGDEVVDRLVDPMLGGVYAGHADQLSLVSTMPALAAAARTEHTLAAAVRAAQAATVRMPGRPVFATVDGGLTRLVAAAATAAGARISLGLLIARGHSGLVSAAEITGFAVSFTAYLLLIPAHGILGAAWGSLAGYGACLLFALVASRATRDRAGRAS